MFATSADNPDLMSDIIKSGCVNINAVDSQGRTALFYVTKDGYEGDWESMIEILINAGIDRSVSDNQGKTAYDYAVEAGDNDLAEFIKP
jgi:ankyrin repeat protein